MWERQGVDERCASRPLIDSRTRNELPAWCTTNCSLEEWEQVIAPRCSLRRATLADVMARDRSGFAETVPGGAFDVSPVLANGL